MPHPPRAGLWLALCLGHTLLVLLAYWLPDTPLAGFGLTLLAVPYLLAPLGLPLLQMSASGGWAAPTALGWFVAVAFWLLFHPVLSSLLGRLAGAFARRRAKRR